MTLRLTTMDFNRKKQSMLTKEKQSKKKKKKKLICYKVGCAENEAFTPY